MSRGPRFVWTARSSPTCGGPIEVIRRRAAVAATARPRRATPRPVDVLDGEIGAPDHRRGGGPDQRPHSRRRGGGRSPPVGRRPRGAAERAAGRSGDADGCAAWPTRPARSMPPPPRRSAQRSPRQPDQAALAFVLGWARIGAGIPDRRRSPRFRNAALLEPKMVAAHLALAETYVALGQPALARQAIDSRAGSLPQSRRAAADGRRAEEARRR